MPTLATLIFGLNVYDIAYNILSLKIEVLVITRVSGMDVSL
jgi:hypothetical protein